MKKKNEFKLKVIKIISFEQVEEMQTNQKKSKKEKLSFKLDSGIVALAINFPSPLPYQT